MSMARYHLRREVAAGHPQIIVALALGLGLRNVNDQQFSVCNQGYA